MIMAVKKMMSLIKMGELGMLVRIKIGSAKLIAFKGMMAGMTSRTISVIVKIMGLMRCLAAGLKRGWWTLTLEQCPCRSWRLCGLWSYFQYLRPLCRRRRASCPGAGGRGGGGSTATLRNSYGAPFSGWGFAGGRNDTEHLMATAEGMVDLQQE
jgi:hypothetical protein